MAHGSYIRKHFFGRYPQLLKLVNSLKDEELRKLQRGGHDTEKVFAAYKAAVEHRGEPTVILAKTIKGYGLGEAGEGRNITHQQKKLNEKELREFRRRFQIPISDEEVVETPFFRPAEESPEMQYLHQKREALGGYLPQRKVATTPLKTPDIAFFEEFLKGSDGVAASTTMAFVRMLTKMLRDKEIGERIVPIIPDEARTFGMDALFRQIGIYASKGQLYEPVDKESFLFYNEDSKGQILEEGITEAGAMSSFIAAGTAYATLQSPMIPFYVYYSMFGFQRIGDLIWLAGDMRARGFLLGATSGRTTLNGEGLQHQDGQSLMLASTIPSIEAYDPAFAFEIAVIVEDGLRRMYSLQEDRCYYLALYNEPYDMPPMPEGVEEGIRRGLYLFSQGKASEGRPAQIIASGSLMKEALRAQELLAARGVNASVWSATSYNRLRREALQAERWNVLHPKEEPRRSFLETAVEHQGGPFIAVSDHIKGVPQQIAPWIPGGLATLGTDGFGRSDSRERLRRFFEVDAELVTIRTLYELARRGEGDMEEVCRTIDELGVDRDKVDPLIS